MKKRLTLLAFLFLLGFIFSYYFGVFPFVNENKLINTTDNSSIDLLQGDRVSLFEGYNFNEEDYSFYIVFSSKEKIRFSRVLFTNKKEVLNQIKEAFDFTYSGGDMATCESYLYLKKADKTVLKVGIAFDETVGVQSGRYGWLEFKDNKKLEIVLKQLESVYYPFLKL